MSKFYIFAKRYIHFFLTIFLLFFLSISLFIILDTVLNPPITIIAEFDELGPLYKSMPVYYKGYKIGKTSTIKPSKDFKTTFVTIVFYPEELNLPSNIRAKVKKLNIGIDYINLEYPQTPSKTLLKKGDIIQGTTSIDIQSFMSAQADSGLLGSITENVDSTLSTFNDAGKECIKLIQTLTDTVNENRPAIKSATNNLNITTEKLKNLATKVDNAISAEKIKTSINNIENTTSNISQTSANITQISSDIQKATKTIDKNLHYIDSILCQINATATNLQEITTGIKNTLNKKMGVLKLLLNKPIENKK